MPEAANLFEAQVEARGELRSMALDGMRCACRVQVCPEVMPEVTEPVLMGDRTSLGVRVYEIAPAVVDMAVSMLTAPAKHSLAARPKSLRPMLDLENRLRSSQLWNPDWHGLPRTRALARARAVMPMMDLVIRTVDCMDIQIAHLSIVASERSQ